MAECTITSKICLALLCLIFWAAGAGLLFIGIEVFVTYNNVSQITSAMYTLVPAAIIICVGVFMFILGLVGCIGGCKESKALLAVFFTVLLVILVCEAAAGFLGFAYRASVEKAVQDGMDRALKNYTNNDTLTTEVDYIQRTFQCCGVTNYTDWASTDWGDLHQGLVPVTCCTNVTQCQQSQDYKRRGGVDPAVEKINEKGCLNLLKDKFNTYLGVIAGVAFGFALLEILGMICSCILLCRTQKDLPYSELHEDPDRLRRGDVRA